MSLLTQVADNLKNDALCDDTPADLQTQIRAQNLAIQLALEIFILSLDMTLSWCYQAKYATRDPNNE